MYFTVYQRPLQNPVKYLRCFLDVLQVSERSSVYVQPQCNITNFEDMRKSRGLELFHDGRPYHIETNPLICSASHIIHNF